ncbi:MAG: thioredoxin [Candidatus Hinthialibacter antarcticus]|nr:thioredoxin [Candidatus Hinthialibacter antarcticus]
MSNAPEVATATFESEVIQSSVPVLVDFSATWCGPCQKMAPLIDELASEYDGKAKVVKVDVDNSQDLATKYGVMSVPTIVLLKGGEIVNKWIGFTPKQTLADALDGSVS